MPLTSRNTVFSRALYPMCSQGVMIRSRFVRPADSGRCAMWEVARGKAPPLGTVGAKAVLLTAGWRCILHFPLTGPAPTCRGMAAV